MKFSENSEVSMVKRLNRKAHKEKRKVHKEKIPEKK